MRVKAHILGANCLELEIGDTIFLQSYSTIVAAKRNGHIYLGGKWDYSVTTAKHVCKFTGYTSKELRKMIKSGDVQVVDLEEWPYVE